MMGIAITYELANLTLLGLFFYVSYRKKESNDLD
tara:strand:- start:811 stop:912 length:102 start_codon:yes stop_codon:yes gene_type:complete